MHDSKMQRWLKNIQETLPEEISCSECFDMVSVYVDLEVAGKPAEKMLPQLKQHLNQCLVCRQEYELLHDLAMAEEHGSESSVDDLQNKIKGAGPET